MDTARCRLSDAQDTCEIGIGRPENWLAGTIGRLFDAPLLSVRTTRWYSGRKLLVLSGHDADRGGWLAYASLVPSGLMAGSWPDVFCTAVPAPTGTSSMVLAQPFCTAK